MVTYKWIMLITLLGAFLRFADLGKAPLWIDEAMLGTHMLTQQEYIGNILIVHDDLWLRFPYALAGTLTIPVFWWAMRQRPLAIWGSLLIAVFPLFVFWSRMARPYALAGLFVVLGWVPSFWWMGIISLFSTPAALVGINFKKMPWWGIVFVVALTIAFYFTRIDVMAGKSFFDLNFILAASRLWYLPILTLLLWGCDYIKDKKHIIKGAIAILSVWFLLSSFEIPQHRYGYIPKWYAGYVAFADWRAVPACDFVTNVAPYIWYTNKEVYSYRPNDIKFFQEQLEKKQTLRVGIDYYALNISRNMVPQDILSRYGGYLAQGGVLVLEAKKEKNKITYKVIQ
jgi:hypothetical protein